MKWLSSVVSDQTHRRDERRATSSTNRTWEQKTHGQPPRTPPACSQDTRDFISKRCEHAVAQALRLCVIS